MEITWYGQTCFRLSERGLATVVTDPYPPDVGLTFPRPRADVVTVSYDDPQCRHTSGVRGPFKLFDGPGEYEVGGVFITGIATFADGKHGASRGLNTVFTFDFGGLTVCHLGRLGHVPTQSQVENLGTVNVLLVPVGSGGSLSPARASEVISLFEPSLVVPMYYKVRGLKISLGTLGRFLKEMGLEKVDGQQVLKVSRTSLSEETRVVVLEPKQRNGG
ncbi:MAG TPA: MBL fold metallo-hydrolase [Anaerolineae bacterium]|nr:MBL fold metallo-hydrolase [Anaerolineae bacterium]